MNTLATVALATRLTRLIRTVDMSYFPIPVKFGVQIHRPGVYLHCTFPVRGIHDGSIGDANTLLLVPKEALHATDEQLVCLLREIALSTIRHELDECMVVSGRRPLDPHKPRSPSLANALKISEKWAGKVDV